MDSSSLHKRYTAAIVFFLVIILFIVFLFWLFFLNGAYMLTSLAVKEPYEKYPNSVWVSEDPEIYMTVSESPYTTGGSFVVKDGQRTEVSIYVMRAESRVIISALSSNGNVHTVLLEGDSVRVKASEISFRVTFDELFDGRYSTIVLKRQA